MTELRKRMVEELALRGLSDRTNEAYTSAVSHLARYFWTCPSKLSEEQVRAYLVYLAVEKKVARSTHTIALCGIRCLYADVLGREWGIFDVARPKASSKLPVVLSRRETWRILDQVNNPVYRACLTAIYSMGLRLMEGALIQIEDVDSDRGLVHIHGKGARDRYVPMPKRTLELLRESWARHRSPVLFPASVRVDGKYVVGKNDKPVTRWALQSGLNHALKKSGVHKKAHVHTLRHSYATHLYEDGVPLRVIQGYLGHASMRTTEIYAHLTRVIRKRALAPVERLMDRP